MNWSAGRRSPVAGRRPPAAGRRPRRPVAADQDAPSRQTRSPRLRRVLRAARHAMKPGVQCVPAYWKSSFMALRLPSVGVSTVHEGIVGHGNLLMPRHVTCA